MSSHYLVDCGNGVRLERGVPCCMSDGVKLYSDHYYPATGQPQPTLLMRQPYGRDIASTVVYAHPVWFARHGYNVVIQDVRGRGDSEGEFYPFRHEARDGAETIAALRKRPESNGRVGMYGFSYQGMTQWLAAAEQPEGLLCIAPAQTAHDLYRGWFYQNGSLRLASSMAWGLQMLKADARRLSLHEASERLERAWANLAAQYLETPYNRHLAIRSEGLPAYVTDWFEQDTPSDYWSRLDISQSMHKINIPALHLSGWFDTYLSGSVDGFLTACASAAVEARQQQYLVAGPWTHIPWGDRIGSLSLGSEAALDTDSLHLRWFDHWLKQKGTFDGEPRIRYFALQQNAWHAAEAWPEPGYTLYLHSAGRANSSKGDGLLNALPPAENEPSDIFVYDPEVPVVAPGGLANVAGPANQAWSEQGNNLVLYTGVELKQPLHVFGHPQVALYAATSAAAADLVAKLVCVKPSGEAVFVCLGVARSTYLFEAYEADSPHLWRFNLDPTSFVFEPGDRIRLEVASSAYPLFDRNPSTAIPARLASPWNWARSTQRLLHTGRMSSALHLPVAQEVA